MAAAVSATRSGTAPLLCGTKELIVSRQELKALQSKAPSNSTVQVAYSRPGQPVLIRRSQEDCQLVFPVWVPENSGKAYMTAFIQVNNRLFFSSVKSQRFQSFCATSAPNCIVVPLSSDWPGRRQVSKFETT